MCSCSARCTGTARSGGAVVVDGEGHYHLGRGGGHQGLGARNEVHQHVHRAALREDGPLAADVAAERAQAAEGALQATTHTAQRSGE